MTEPRPLGRWRLTALVINSIIGSAIFGIPSEAIHAAGSLSPLAMLNAAVLMAIVILPVAEVASQFSSQGGLYLYARAVFGRFVGLQVGWFWFLAIVGGGAAAANLFCQYLARFAPALAHGWPRLLVLLLVIAGPTLANYRGVNLGANLSLLFTLAKALPLAILIGLGLFSTHSATAGAPASHSLDIQSWLKLLLVLSYGFSGWEDALAPSGEVREPHRSIPVALISGLAICAAIYTSFQWVIYRLVGPAAGPHAVSDAAAHLLGSGAGTFVAVAAMLSSYGWISGAFFNAPRYPLALATHGDCPPVLGSVHPRFRTPWFGVLLYGAAVYLIAATGTFLWAIALTAGSLTIFYSVGCAALFRLRKSQPNAQAFRAPFGPLLAALGILISFALLTQVEPQQLLLMLITSLIATLNWLWAKQEGHRH